MRTAENGNAHGHWHVACTYARMRHFLRPNTHARVSLAAVTMAFASWVCMGSCAFAQASAQPPPPPPPTTRQPANAPPPQDPAAAPTPAPQDGRPGPAPQGPAGPPLVPPIPNGSTRIGTIVVSRPYLVQIQSPNGAYVTLALHRGTVINPLGTTLVPGMRIAVRGIPQSDGSVVADQIDLQARRGPLGPPPGPGGPGRPPSLRSGGPRPPR